MMTYFILKYDNELLFQSSNVTHQFQKGDVVKFQSKHYKVLDTIYEFKFESLINDTKVALIKVLLSDELPMYQNY